jgi:hypothetical protein
MDLVKGYDHGDPALADIAGPTVWDLQEMAYSGRFAELDHLFDNGVTMNALPAGIAAGTAFGVFDSGSKVVTGFVRALAGKNWRGKIVFPSNNKTISEGRNRIRQSPLHPRSPIVPMARFDATLVPSHPLAPHAKSNMVAITYAQPLTRPYLQERLLTVVGLIDIMVAVRGRYGPVFVGKTWLGRYDKNGGFRAAQPDRLFARYFLDFNAAALKEQSDTHWDGSPEELLDPLPHIGN